MYKTILSFAIIALLVIISACSNSVSDDHSAHSEPEGFRLKMSGGTLVEQLPDEGVTGSITIPEGQETALISVWFIDHDGDEFQPDVEEGYSLGYQFSNEGVVAFEQHEGDGAWSFHLHGEAVGTTNFSVSILHGGHNDFVSQNIPVTVNAAN